MLHLSDTLYGTRKALAGRVLGPWEVVTPPTGEPVVLASMKQYLQVDHDAENSVIERLIKAARDRIERKYGALFLEQTVRVRAQGLGSYLPLPVSPVSAITSATHVSDAGVSEAQLLSNYVLTTGGRPQVALSGGGRLVPAGYTLALEITAGHAASTDIPPVLIEALYKLVHDWYYHRGTFTTGTVTTRFPDDVDKMLAGAGYKRR